MALVLLIGAIIIIASAVRNTQQELFDALREDVPAYVVWAAAIIAIGAIGYLPGMKGISRALLMLVIVVLLVNNYQKIGDGFMNAWKSPPPAEKADPANSGGGSGGGLLKGALKIGEHAAVDAGMAAIGI